MDDKDVLRQIDHYLTKTQKRQYELAAEIGAPAQTVNRWLTGKAKISRAYRALLKERGILH